MKKNKNKIIVGILVCMVLFICFFVNKSIFKSTEEDFLIDSTNMQEISTTDNSIKQSAESPIISTPTPTPLDNKVDEQKTQDSFIKENAREDKTPVVQKQPEETEKAENSTDFPACTLSVRCDSVFKNLEMLSAGKKEIMPPDGIIFPEQRVSFSAGESVFDILKRELKNNKIHLEYVITPMYNSAYIEGIRNLYEFDCGEYSGWQYKVNGTKPTIGCSQYKPNAGDKIEFFYSCNFFDD